MRGILAVVSLLWSMTLLSAAQRKQGNVKVRDCEPIELDTCRNLGYNVTGMPNLVGHENQADAQLQFNTFNPLIQYECSRLLKFFLCSVYFPMCTEKVLEPIGPCRPMCNHVQAMCRPVLKTFGFPWPSALNCSKFPLQNDQDHMCMEGPALPSEELNPNHSQQVSQTSPMVAHDPSHSSKQEVTKVSAACLHLKNGHNYIYINRTGMCALQCKKDDLFTAADKEFADIWMIILTLLCFASTLFTALTFMIDSSRFRYPERCIVFLSLCYNMWSIAYIVRLIAGRYAISCGVDTASQLLILIQEGLDNTDCAIVFLLQFYFGTASSIWWVLLTMTWLLAAGLKWSSEAIERHATYFHVIAWSVPAIKTIVILVMRDVDADELTGMCYVGNQRQDTLLGFVIIPLCIYLVLGVIFLVAGFISMFRVRRQVQREGHKTEKLEALMVRIGIFSGLYTVPAACVIACYLYEYANRQLWHSAVSGEYHTPNMEIFMLRIFMAMVIGVTSGMWMWSSKTIHSWQSLCNRICRCPTERKNRAYPQYHYHPSQTYPGLTPTVPAPSPLGTENSSQNPGFLPPCHHHLTAPNLHLHNATQYKKSKRLKNGVVL